MNIVIVGDGKVGSALTLQLAKEGHDVVVIDSNKMVLQEAQQAANQLLTQDPALTSPDNRPVLQRVRQMFADTPDIFN